MKLVINRDVLLSALNQVLGAISTRSTLPILGCVHCVGDGDQRITLTGTNLEMTLRVVIEGIKHEPFTSVWPAKRLYDILKAFPKEGMVGISEEEQKVTIKCGRSRFVLMTYDANDFPMIDEGIDFDVVFATDATQLNLRLQRTDFAIAHNDVRYYLEGLCFNGIGNEVRLVATDGHRLAKEIMIVESEFTDSFEAILPSQAVLELRKISLNVDGEIMVSIRPNLFKFVTDHLTFLAKRLDGRFPDYERVIPKEMDCWVKANREDLFSALQRVKLVLDSKEKGIRVTVADQSLLIEGMGFEDHAEDRLDVQHEGEVSIGLNVDYLMDILRVLTEEEIKIEFMDANSLIKIESATGTYIVMPMRL